MRRKAVERTRPLQDEAEGRDLYPEIILTLRSEAKPSLEG
jgi:hypothetical protein